MDHISIAYNGLLVLEKNRVNFGSVYIPISLIYVGFILYIMFLCLKHLKKVKNREDRTFAKLLLLFSSISLLESIYNVIFISNNIILKINITEPEILLTSIPHLIIGIYTVSMVFKIILSKDTPTQEDIIALGFSHRESELIELILKGYTNNQISEELSISLSTVKTHINNIFKKANVSSRFELLKVVKN